MSVVLRDYQEAAVTKTLDAVKSGLSPVVALPTGSGKSLVAAALCATLPGRVLVASHRQELLEQDAGALATYAPEVSYGLYSASLGRRDVSQRVIFGGVQSIYTKMDALQAVGRFAAILIDEAHLVARQNTDIIMYQRVFAACPEAVRVGLSATPFRLDSGLLYEGEGRWFDTLACHVSMRALTPEYLAPLRGVLTAHNIDVEGVRLKAGEFVPSELAQAAMQEDVMQAAVDEFVKLARLRHHWLVFCVDVAHTEAIADLLQARGIPCGVLLGTTPQDQRRELLRQFKAGELRAMVNCQVFTTGFDYPGIDCIALLRPTMSKALCLQMMGWGARQAPAKVDCVVFDYAGNIERHAPLDELWDIRKTPARKTAEEAAERAREEAEERVRQLRAKHLGRASTLDPMTGETARTVTYAVARVIYDVVKSRNPKYPGTEMIRVTYYCPERKARQPGSPPWIWQWVCLEYTGWVRSQAVQWFQRRGLGPVPSSAHEARRSLDRLPVPTSLRVIEKDPYPQIVLEHFADEPDESPQPGRLGCRGAR